MSREAGIADYGMVLTGELDDDSLSYNSAAMDARCVRLSDDVLYTDIDVVSS